jgi:hypothetical protein
MKDMHKGVEMLHDPNFCLFLESNKIASRGITLGGRPDIVTAYKI